MATMVKLSKILPPNVKVLGHKNAKIRARFVADGVKNPPTILVDECFPDGTVFISVYTYGWMEIAKTVAGLFDENSNFAEELEKVYPGVKFKDLYLKLAPCEVVHVTKQNASVEYICSEMNRINEMELNHGHSH